MNMMETTEYRVAPDGSTVTIMWSEDRKSAELTLEPAHRIGIVYNARRGERSIWFSLEDPSKEYRNSDYAIDAVITNHFGIHRRRQLL